MITKVVDSDGTVLHDCADAGCEISWDGVALTDTEVDDHSKPDAGGNPAKVKISKGEKVPGADEPDPQQWRIVGSTARLISKGK